MSKRERGSCQSTKLRDCEDDNRGGVQNAIFLRFSLVFGLVCCHSLLRQLFRSRWVRGTQNQRFCECSRFFMVLHPN
ncbi:hypothetical protein SISSUDRAFT_404383 [Sistotremastrum suecicum HHB10207 ss-3]|uniref:Uncharacterized protein n=1 Tax=Sistotremastrum suecicum HHB10207 ss-3 TaxID=1314776 RepID=A0A166FTW9_9AGAM|nr:hypothetical protein SISSUDRAFT_404383 [Sistotremastrum suecicum HHB10207 ss-3]